MTSNLTSNIENIKIQKDGLDVLSDIYIHAVLGEKIDPSDLIRFKWYGIHAQDKKDDLFKLKIPIALGSLNIDQLKVLEKILNQYGKKSFTMTKNQKIELSNLKIYDIPNIFSLLDSVNLNTIFESGDTVRNVATCAISGINAENIIDIEDIAEKLNQNFKGSKLFSNLPNRLKIAISGCGKNCIHHSKQDIEFKAIKNENDKILFKTEICGHHVGYITPSQVLPLSKAVAKLYREYGDREDLSNNSFENLVESWGIVKFFDILDLSINFRVKKIELSDNYNESSEHLGINIDKMGKNYLGVKPKSSIMTNEKLNKLILILEKYNVEKIKLASMGNLFFLNIESQVAVNFEKDIATLEI